MPDKKLTDNEIIKALERLKSTKCYLKEQYQEQVKKCPYPELKPIAKQTYEDNKKAFDIAIKAIEEFNRLQAEVKYKQSMIDLKENELQSYYLRNKKLQAENERLNKALIEQKLKNNMLYETAKEIEIKAYKEFADRLHEELRMYGTKDKFNKAVFLNVVDRAKKELVGDNT